MYQEDIAEVRAIVKEEIEAAGADSEKKIKELEAQLKKAMGDSKTMLDVVIKDLEAKIKKAVDTISKVATTKTTKSGGR